MDGEWIISTAFIITQIKKKHCKLLRVFNHIFEFIKWPGVETTRDVITK